MRLRYPNILRCTLAPPQELYHAAPRGGARLITASSIDVAALCWYAAKALPCAAEVVCRRLRRCDALLQL
jgi:hypothetical protein